MMMEHIMINETILVVSAMLLFFALTTPFLNAFFRGRKLQSTPTDDEEEPLPPLSIILTPHENAAELERNLPLLLSQDYPAPFEVIVVTWKGDSETEDVLKRFADDEHLYTTYIPSSSRYMSRKKLAITLGVKAAKNEWIMLTDSECQPTSDQWLRLMARHARKGNDLVIGYTAYDNDTSSYRRFERLHTALYLLREDLHATPYRHNGSNLLLRKSVFISGDGFRGNLKFLRGEYDFIVNKYATDSNTAVELDSRSWMVEQEPTDKTWLGKHLFYQENRRHLHRSLRHRLLFNLDQWALHLNYIFIIAALALSILLQLWVITAAATLALLITIVSRTIIARSVLTQFDEDISAWRIVPCELSILWHNLSHIIKHRRADKNDFISHKI